MSRTISAGYVYRQYSTEGVYIADYKSSRAAHEATGVSIGSIARAAHGERRTGGGYVWRKVLADSPKESIEIDLISKIGNHDKTSSGPEKSGWRNRWGIPFHCPCQPES